MKSEIEKKSALIESTSEHYIEQYEDLERRLSETEAQLQLAYKMFKDEIENSKNKDSSLKYFKQQYEELEKTYH